MSPVRAPQALSAILTLPLLLACATTPKFVVPADPEALAKFNLDRFHCDNVAGAYSGIGVTIGQQLLALAYSQKAFKDCMLEHGYELAGQQRPSPVQVAQSGDAQAQYALGRGYAYGNGVVQDFDQAHYWFGQAANQGHGQAQLELGHLFFRGDGVISDPDEAERRYRLAAQQGVDAAIVMLAILNAVMENAPADESEAADSYRARAEGGDVGARFVLGMLYHLGRGVQENAVESAAWVRRAAEQNHHLAQFVLASFYLDGTGVPINYVLAHQWLNLSMTSGEEWTKINVRQVLNKLELSMTKDQIAEAQALASQWYEAQGTPGSNTPTVSRPPPSHTKSSN